MLKTKLTHCGWWHPWAGTPGQAPLSSIRRQNKQAGEGGVTANSIPPRLVLVPALASLNELCPGICKPRNSSLPELISILVFTTTIDSKLRWIQLVIFIPDSVLSSNSTSVLQGSVMLLGLSCVYYEVASLILGQLVPLVSSQSHLTSYSGSMPQPVCSPHPLKSSWIVCSLWLL